MRKGEIRKGGEKKKGKGRERKGDTGKGKGKREWRKEGNRQEKRVHLAGQEKLLKCQFEQFLNAVASVSTPRPL